MHYADIHQICIVFLLRQYAPKFVRPAPVFVQQFVFFDDPASSSTDDIIEPFRQVHLKPQWNKGLSETAFSRLKIDSEKAVFGMRVANNYSERANPDKDFVIDTEAI